MKTILLTRPRPQSETFAKDVENLYADRARFVISPLLDIDAMGWLPNLAPFQAVLFTSANGVRTFVEKGGKTRAPCICVGDKTTEVARQNGLDAYSAKGAAKDLVMLAAHVLDPRGGPLLYVRGKMGTGDIAENLTKLGFAIEEVVLYRQNPRPLLNKVEKLFAAGNIDLIPLFSPMTAKLLAEEFAKNPDWPTDHISAICISQKVANNLADLTLSSITISDKATQESMLTAVGRYLCR